MRPDDATLLDLAKAARLAVRFAEGFDRDAFLADAKTQAAVLHELLVIGEAVKRLSEAFRTAHPDIPWRAMAGMRDKLIHAYDAVDIEEVWKTLRGDIPALIDFLLSSTLGHPISRTIHKAAAGRRPSGAGPGEVRGHSAGGRSSRTWSGSTRRHVGG